MFKKRKGILALWELALLVPSYLYYIEKVLVDQYVHMNKVFSIFNGKALVKTNVFE